LYSRTLDGITRALYTFTQALEVADGLLRLIISFFLEEVIAPNWDKDWILLEDNDNAPGTRGNANNKVKQAKARLGI
jgi:hypothetical protein